MDARHIAVSSHASLCNGSSFSAVIILSSISNSIQRADSSTSSATIPSLEMKSFFDRPRHAAL